ncbi:MAG: hypothetical protein ACO1OG_10895 [Devosia sp.]
MRRLAIAAGLTALLAAPAMAQQIESSFTELDLNMLCTVMQSDDFGSTWACPGLKGMPVVVKEVDRRMFVSFGLDSTKEIAATQTIKPYNQLGPGIEWRVSNADGYFKPFAAIVPLTATPETGDVPQQVAVVIRIAPGATCHVAYVDVLANADAETLARKAADELAPGFDCATGEVTYPGEFKAWTR